MELLQKVAEARGRLLRVQCYRARGERGAKARGLVSGLLLTFDVGRILVWADSQAADREASAAAAGRAAVQEATVKEAAAREDDRSPLLFMHVDDTEDMAGGLMVLDESEPWWRVVGSPLCRVRASVDPPSVRLQFREQERSPRFIELGKSGGLIRIRRVDGA